MNVREEVSKHHRFIYAKTFEDENETNDSSGSELASISGKTKKRKSGDKTATMSTHDSKSRVYDAEVESAVTASELKDSKPKSASELMFTFCYRSVGCDTYKFLDAEVAERLTSLVETLWDPLVLVDGDLEQRKEVERGFIKKRSKAILSEVVGDEELRVSIREAFLESPGETT